MRAIEQGIKHLKENGLNLFAVINCADLPTPTTKFMMGSGIPVADYRRLVLIGHGGKCMWDKLHSADIQENDPIDSYSTSLTQRFISKHLNDATVLWLYPDSRYIVPLQQLGEIAGWCSPSPLGSGISSEYGVWFAYRTAFLIDEDLPLRSQSPLPSPCDSCLEKPCIVNCPALAVQSDGFELERCAQHRLALHSPCAEKCLSRLACPVHTEHRYSAEQIKYHYRQSLLTLRNWYSE